MPALTAAYPFRMLLLLALCKIQLACSMGTHRSGCHPLRSTSLFAPLLRLQCVAAGESTDLAELYHPEHREVAVLGVTALQALSSFAVLRLNLVELRHPERSEGSELRGSTKLSTYP